MCDYSLAAFNSRLGKEGEQLVTYRFPTGCYGLVPVADLENAKLSGAPKGIMDAIRQSVTGYSSEWRPCAICIPPGAKLTLSGIPEDIQHQYGVNESEEVTFDQLNASANTYRDAFRFRTGDAVLIQRFKCYVYARLDSLEGSTEHVPFRERAFAAR